MSLNQIGWDYSKLDSIEDTLAAPRTCNSNDNERLRKRTSFSKRYKVQ